MSSRQTHSGSDLDLAVHFGDTDIEYPNFANLKFSGDDWEQFRRCIRYLKRWKDLKFQSDGNAAPVGIGITVSAYHWFKTRKTCIDPFKGKHKYDDHGALIDFLQLVIDNFTDQVSKASGSASQPASVVCPGGLSGFYYSPPAKPLSSKTNESTLNAALSTLISRWRQDILLGS